jgi:HK97 family phage portal protein
MGLLTWIGERIGRAMAQADGSRAFVTGPAVVDPFRQETGYDPAEIASTKLLTYATLSNAVYTCVRLRASLLSSLPLRFYRVRGGERREVTSGPVVELFSRVNPFWTWNRLIEMIEWSLCLTGSAYVFLERGNGARLGPPRELWWARPDRVRVLPDRDRYVRGFVYEAWGSEPIPFSPEETWWLRYPNPLNEYAGLSPLAAARLSADLAIAATNANVGLFERGIQAGGFLFPGPGQPDFSPQERKVLEEVLNREFKGARNAHRWGVFDREIGVKQLALSPKDAEFLGALKWSLEDVARAFGVPLDLIGGQRTYENVNAARLAVWTDTIVPEARFIATEITEQILPMFSGQADVAEFDFSGVAVLRESEAERWQIAAGELDRGVITINEYRQQRGLDPVPWGDAWWAPSNLAPVATSQPPEPAQPAEQQPAPERMQRQHQAPGSLPYGSPEHVAYLARVAEVLDPHEERVRDVVQSLFRRQRQAILTKLSQVELERDAHGMRLSAGDLLAKIFAMPRWIKEFQRAAYTPRGEEPPEGFLPPVAQDMGNATLASLDLAMAFDVLDPHVVRALEGQAQRFAREVNETTWQALKSELSDGLANGEGIPQLMSRVQNVMQNRLFEAERIARTEVVAASTSGSIEAARQSGVVAMKEWVATLDGRTRLEHFLAHGQRRKLHENFDVGGATGPGPGLMSTAAMSVNCRCTLRFITDVEAAL